MPYLEQKLYDGFNITSMSMAEGDFIKADYILDCSYFQYYSRLMTFNEWAKRENEKTEKMIKKAKSGKG